MLTRFLLVAILVWFSSGLGARVLLLAKPHGGLNFDVESVMAPSKSSTRNLPWDSNISVSPRLDESRRIIFTGSIDHRLYAIDADTGQNLFFIKADGRVTTQVVISSATGSLFFGTDKGLLYQRDAYSFAPMLEVKTDAPINDDLVIVKDSLLIFTTKLSTVYAIDLKTKKVAWRVERPLAQTRLKLVSLSNILFFASKKTDLEFGASTLIVPHSDGYLSFIDPISGVVRRQVSLNIEQSEVKFPDIVAPMIIHGNNLYCASYELGVFALDAFSGQIRWHHRAKGIVQLLWYKEKLFGLSTGHLFSFAANLKEVMHVDFSKLRTRRARYGYPFQHARLGDREVFSGVPSSMVLVNDSIVFGMSRGGIAQFSQDGIFEYIGGWSLGVGPKIEKLGKDVIAVTRNGWVIRYSPVSYKNINPKKAGRFREIIATRR